MLEAMEAAEPQIGGVILDQAANLQFDRDAVDELTGRMMDALSSGNREEAKRLFEERNLLFAEPGDTDEVEIDDSMFRPEPMAVAEFEAVRSKIANASGNGYGLLSEWGTNAPQELGYATAAMEHLRGVAPEFVDFLGEPDADGRRAGSDAAWVKMAAMYGKARAASLSAEASLPAPPPATEDMAQAAAAVLGAQEGGAQTVAALGGTGSRQFAENIAYVQRAVAHIQKHNPALIERLSALDADGRLIADRPEVVAMAVSYGRMLSAGGKAANRNGSVTTAQKGTPKMSSQDIDPDESPQERLSRLTAEHMMARSSGNTIKARRLEQEARRTAELLSGNGPIVGSGGRTA